MCARPHHQWLFLDHPRQAERTLLDPREVLKQRAAQRRERERTRLAAEEEARRRREVEDERGHRTASGGAPGSEDDEFGHPLWSAAPGKQASSEAGASKQPTAEGACAALVRVASLA